jgi:hypothetical protein
MPIIYPSKKFLKCHAIKAEFHIIFNIHFSSIFWDNTDNNVACDTTNNIKFLVKTTYIYLYLKFGHAPELRK